MRFVRYGNGMDPQSQTLPPPAANPAAQDIYLLAAHPNWRESRVNRQLLASARSISRVDVCDLYGRYPDYCIDVARERTRVEAAQLIVLMHPIHWYSMPALQKLWLDEVLSHGWAYGRGGVALAFSRAAPSASRSRTHSTIYAGAPTTRAARPTNMCGSS